MKATVVELWQRDVRIQEAKVHQVKARVVELVVVRVVVGRGSGTSSGSER